MGKTIITGTGRAGTSFLVQVMTMLKMPTGFTNPFQRWKHEQNGGMETSWRGAKPEHLPEIIKDPTICFEIENMLSADFPIDHVIVPVRKLQEAAQSRREGGVWWEGKIKFHEKFGGMENLLSCALGTLTHSLIMNDIPHTFIKFPRLVHDFEYLWQSLYLIWCKYGIKKDEFVSVFKKLSHSFEGEKTT